MVGERKRLREKIYSLNNLLHTVQVMQPTLVEYVSEPDAEHIVTTVQKAMQQLQAKIINLPLGHRFTGTYYLREPYSNPVRITKIEGSAYLREDLVSWEVEPDGQPSERYGYFRQLYHDPQCQRMLQRDDGEPVFEQPDAESDSA